MVIICGYIIAYHRKNCNNKMITFVIFVILHIMVG